jgi:hypothetical protein
VAVSDFEDALRGTMAQPNRGFEQAEADLHAETNAASVGIDNLTNKRGSLGLGATREVAEGVWYELWLHFRPPGLGNDTPRQGADRVKKYTLGTFFVPWQGYPIRTGHGLELPDRRSIAAYFVDMARNPASALVNYLTFNLRRQEQPAAGG